MLSEEQLKLIFDRDMDFFLNTIKRLDTLKPDGQVSACFGLGLDASNIAINYMLLGNVAEARSWFGKAAKYFNENVIGTRKIVDKKEPGWLSIIESEPGTCERALQMSILSENKEIVDDSIAVALSIRDDYRQVVSGPIPNYYYARSLSCYLNEDMENAMSNAGLIKRTDNYKFYFEGLKSSLSGLVKSDKGMIVEGLDRVLASHHRIYCSLKSGEGVICYPASAHVKLALRKGLLISPEDFKKKYGRYLPMTLIE